MKTRGALIWVRTLTVLCLFGAGCSSVGGPSGSQGYAIGVPANAVVVTTSTNAVGRVTSSGNGLVRGFHQYDIRGRATAVQHVMDNWSYVYTNTYGYPQSVVAATGPKEDSSRFRSTGVATAADHLKRSTAGRT
jgi:hypothetical protein